MDQSDKLQTVNSFLNTLERKFGWLAFPGILRVVICFQVLVYVLIVLTSNDSEVSFVAEKLSPGPGSDPSRRGLADFELPPHPPDNEPRSSFSSW